MEDGCQSSAARCDASGSSPRSLKVPRQGDGNNGPLTTDGRRLFAIKTCDRGIVFLRPPIFNRKSRGASPRRPAHGRALVVDGSTARRVAPPRPDVLAVSDDARHRRVAARKGEHLLAPRAVVLRVVLGPLDPLLAVVVARRLAVRTPRLD